MLHRLSTITALFAIILSLLGAAAQPALAAPLPAPLPAAQAEPAMPPSARTGGSVWIFLKSFDPAAPLDPKKFDSVFKPLRLVLDKARQAEELDGYTPFPDGFAVRLYDPSAKLMGQIGRLSEVESVLNEGPGLDEILTRRFAPAHRALPEAGPAFDLSQPQEAAAAVQPSAGSPPLAPESPSGTGKFNVYLYSDGISGSTVVPGAAVQMIVSRSDTTLLSKTLSSDLTDGIYYVSLYQETGSWDLNLMPGDVITVTETGQAANTMTLPDAWMMVNSATDIVSGKAFPDTQVRVRIDEEQETTAGADGAFNLHSDLDIKYTTGHISASMTDPASGNHVTLTTVPARFEAHLGEIGEVCGTTGHAGPQEVVLVNRYLDSQWIDESEAEPEIDGQYCAPMNGLSAGQRITAQTIAGEILDFTITPLTLTADPAANTLSGMAVPGVEVTGYARHRRGWETQSFSLTADAAGDFSFTVTGFDLIGGDDGNAIYTSPAGHRVGINFSVPYIHVNLSQDYGFFNSLPLEPYTAQLFSPDGQLKGTTSGITRDYGSDNFDFYLADTYELIDIASGDRLIIQHGSNQPPFDFVIPPLQITPDLDADQIEIQSVPDSSMTVYINEIGFMEETYLYTSATTDATGHALISLAPFDLNYTDGVEVYFSLADGNMISEGFILPSRVVVYEAENIARVTSANSAPLTAQLLAPGGALKTQITMQTQRDGFAYLGTLGDIAPGDTLRVICAGVTTNVLVQPLIITEIDRVVGRVSGQTTPGVQVGGSHNIYNKLMTTADPSGNFTIDFAPPNPMQGGNQIEIRLFDPVTGARQILEQQAPYVQFDWSENTLRGRASVHGGVVVHLRNGAGDLIETAVTTADRNSYSDWMVWFSEDAQPGDQFEVISSTGQTLTFTPPSLTLSANAETDTISGSGPAGDRIWLEYWEYMGSRHYSYYNEWTLDGAGSFSIDLNDDLDSMMDLSAFATVSLEWASPVGDRVSTSVSIPGIAAYPDEPYALYDGPYSEEQLLFRLTNSAGALKAEQTVIRDYYSYLEGMCAAGQPLAFEPGDTLEAVGTGAAVTFPELDAVIDPDSNLIYISGPPDTGVGGYLTKYGNEWHGRSSYEIGAQLDSSGKAAIDPEMDIVYGDYVLLEWEDSQGDVVGVMDSTLNRGDLSAQITGYPATARPNSPISLNWTVNSAFGGMDEVTVYYDTESHACDHNYTNATWEYADGQTYGTTLIDTPAGGTLYVSIYTAVSGHAVWSPEIAIPVEDIAPVIVEPVNGTTSLRQPLMRGYAPPNTTIQIKDGATVLNTTTTDKSGEWRYQIVTPLASGLHVLQISAGGRSSEPVNLTVSPGLRVDPNQIFFSDLNTRFRIRDDQGYANLGGTIWTRPDDPMIVQVPITCPAKMPVSAAISVGTVTYPLYYSRGVWQSSFLTPGTDFTVVATINCGPGPEDILLTTGLIDSNGSVRGPDGRYLSGAEVMLMKLDSSLGKFFAWDAATWDQYNPQYTDESGYYSFIAEPGTYRLIVKRHGYTDYTSPDLVVTNQPIRHNVVLERGNETRIFLPLFTRR